MTHKNIIIWSDFNLNEEKVKNANFIADFFNSQSGVGEEDFAEVAVGEHIVAVIGNERTAKEFEDFKNQGRKMFPTKK